MPDIFHGPLPSQAAAAAHFAATRSIVWRDAVDGDVRDRLIAIADRTQFVSDSVEGLGHRDIERPPTVGTAVRLLLNRAPLFAWLEQVTGCQPIGGIEGRVVQTWPRDGDELRWHDDLTGSIKRRLGITIALGRSEFGGGEFQLREQGSGRSLLTWSHHEPGTALIFDVSPRLEHRVLQLTSGGPRRVFTGWFVE